MSADLPDALFLLHCGEIDSGGEPDDWECDVDSQQAVDAFAAMHHGKTVGLYPRSVLDAAVAAAVERCATVARNGCLVLPDGGSPTEDERLLCEEIERRIRATLPPAMAPKEKT